MDIPEHCRRIVDALFLRFPEIAFVLATSKNKSTGEILNSRLVTWLDGPSEEDVDSALQPLRLCDDGMLIGCTRAITCSCCGHWRHPDLPCFNCEEERGKRAKADA
jgi:hypothetical protein